MDEGRRKSSLFRDVNERIRELSAEWDLSQSAGFVCECADTACSELLDLSLPDYEAIRAASDSFVVLPGHEAPQREQVVARNSRHAVVRHMPRPSTAPAT